MGKYKQLTENQRSQIYALKKVLNSQQAIADVIGVNQATISRELSRNQGKKGYRHKQAHKLCNKRRLSASRATKMNRVGGSSRSRPLTPPSIRIRTWRFD